MPDPLLGASEAPPFDLMRMIMEGPRGYFGRRGAIEDQLWLQQQQQQQMGTAAKSLMGTPEFKGALANPLDRQAQFNLWAATQGGPLASQGANWLQTALGAAYGREATTFEDSLARSRIKLNTDEAIRLETWKTDQANQQLQKTWDLIWKPDATGMTGAQKQFQQDAAWDFMAKQGLVRPKPEGMSVVVGPTGQMGFQPTYGTADWRTAMDELGPLQRMQGNISELAKAMDDNTLSTSQAKVLTQAIKDDMRVASKMGSMDEGTAKAMESYLADYGKLTGYTTKEGFITGGTDYLQQRENLRILDYQTKQKLGDWQRKWVISLDDPRAASPYATIPGRPPPPKQPPAIPETKTQSTRKPGPDWEKPAPVQEYVPEWQR